MGLVYFEYQAVRSYRQTYHPPEEIRLQREIARLKADDSPFGFIKIPHISQNAKIRIVEQISEYWGLPHPRLLGDANEFKAKLPGWRTQCQGLYKYYAELRHNEQNESRVVDFMLDDLGFERIDELPLADQIKILKMNCKRTDWFRVSRAVKYHLIFRLAEEAGVVHPRFLTTNHIQAVEIEELGSTLIGLYQYYINRVKDPGKRMTAMLDDAGVPSLESLPLEVQFRGLKERGLIKWGVIPVPIQLRLLEIARERMPEHNGLKCPHLRFLIVDELKVRILDEIGVALGGLHDYYRRRVPEGYGGTSIDYMLDQLGVEKFADLSYEKQCECLRYDNNWRWADIPEALAVHFLDRVREINSLPHLRFINSDQLGLTRIPEIDTTLERMYQHFMIASRPDDERQIMDQILDYYNIPSFSAMPFSLQLRWTHRSRGKLTSWRRVPDAVIGHYLFGMMKEAGITDPFDLQEKHFRLQVGAKGTGLIGLYNYLGDIWPGSGRQTRMLDWAVQQYGLGLRPGIEAKRRAGSHMLDANEILFLIQMAQIGDREALNDLVYFFEPLVINYCLNIKLRFGTKRLTFDELVQAGRVEFTHIVFAHDTSISKFITHIRKSLPWRLRNTIFRDSGVIHRPAGHLEDIRKMAGIRARLAAKLFREPTDEEWATEFGITVDELRAKRMLYAQEISLSKPFGQEDDRTYEDLIEGNSFIRPDKQVMAFDLREKLETAIEGSGLTAKENFALRQYWLEDHTLEEVGEMMNLTGERVHQLKKSAQKKIAASRYGTILKELL